MTKTMAHATLDQEDALVRSRVLIAEIREILKKSPKAKRKDLGGPGSGNFGHGGRPGEVGGSSSEGGGAGAASGSSTIESKPATIENITKHVEVVAERLGYDPAQVDVVDIEPRKFSVAGRDMVEGGHFDPATGRIEINVRTNVDHPVIQGLVAHEMMHAQEDLVRKASDGTEHDEMRQLTAGGGPGDPNRARDIGRPEQKSEFDRLFNKAGFPRKERIAEIEARWPASAALAKYGPMGDAYLGMWAKDADGKWGFDEKEYHERRDKMEKEDGFTAYSKLYWEAYNTAKSKPGGGGLEYHRAMAETVAEVASYNDRAPRGPWKEGVPSKSWQAYGKAIRETYPTVKKKGSADYWTGFEK